MSGFDEAFEAQLARSTQSGQRAATASAERESRLERMRSDCEEQWIEAGMKAVKKLLDEDIAQVDLVADKGRRFRRTAYAGSGWPLGGHPQETDSGGTVYRFRWFLLNDGRLAPNQQYRITSLHPGVGRRLDQLEEFERSWTWLFDRLDIYEQRTVGYRFGGLTSFGTKHATNTLCPADIDLAYNESERKLMHATWDGSGTRVVPAEVAVAELVAQAVLDPPAEYLA